MKFETLNLEDSKSCNLLNTFNYQETILLLVHI